MTNTITMDLAAVNSAAGSAPQTVLLTAVVNPDGTLVGAGGSSSPNINLAQVGGTPMALGRSDMAHSMSVALASDQAAVPVSGTVGISGTVPVSGTVGVSGTVPVSIAGTVSVSAPNPLSVTGTVAISGNVPVTSTSTDNLTQVGGAAISLGQKASAASLPVTVASDQLTALTAFAFAAGSTQTLAVTTTSANVILGAAASGAIQIANAGSSVAFVALGSSAQTATATGYPVLPGATVVISGGGATNIAAIAATGTTTLYVSRGVGL